MNHRVLRGPWLYIGLIALLVILYGPAIHRLGPAPLDLGEPATPEQQLTWWPTQVDGQTFQRVIEAQPWLAMLLSLLGTLMAGFALCGVCLTAWRLGPGRHTTSRANAQHVTPWSLGDLGRVTALIFIIASLLPLARVATASFRLSHPPDTHVWMISSMLILDAFVILAVLAFAMSKRPLFGLSKGRTSAMLVDVFRSYLTAFPWLFFLLYLVAETVRVLGWTPPREPIQELIFGEPRSWVVGLTVLLACVVGPIAEELFFRGVLYGAIRHRTSRFVAVLVSAAAFAALHANPVAFLPIMALGCVLAYVYERTGSLIAPLFIHIVHNTILMSFALLLRGLLPYA